MQFVNVVGVAFIITLTEVTSQLIAQLSRPSERVGRQNLHFRGNKNSESFFDSKRLYYRVYQGFRPGVPNLGYVYPQGT